MASSILAAWTKIVSCSTFCNDGYARSNTTSATISEPILVAKITTFYSNFYNKFVVILSNRFVMITLFS